MADEELSVAVTDGALEAVNQAMIALHERHHGRRPVLARTRMIGDDMLACLLGGVYTDVEKTMIELQRQSLVRETRSVFHQAMQQRFVADVERLTGDVWHASSRPITSDPISRSSCFCWSLEPDPR